jgi:sugar phosphate isomerase/epimerase
MAKADPMSRIGMTTVVFRDRFEDGSTDRLTLSDAPEYYKDRFGIKNIEYWSKHFESREKSYLNDLKKALRKNKCRLINIQADTKNDISDPDSSKRTKALDEMREWIDIASFLGTGMVRASSMKKSYDEAVKSLKILNSYCKEKGLKLLVENHYDLFSIPANHTKVVEDIPDKNLRLLADFGNYKKGIDNYQALEQIAPYTALVSAKTADYDENYKHISYDFARCVKIMESAGYKGIYSLEQWGAKKDYDYERIVDWMIAQIKEVLET